MDWGSTLVEVSYATHRIECPEHGVLVADVPWAYPNSHFTKDFDLTVGWLALYLPRSAVSEYMRIDWETVGRCIHRTLNVIEPQRSKRLDNLVHIGIDETSYRKGHKYITVIVNHDTNSVVWAAQGHGKAVLESFYWQLSKEQLSSIRVVTGDGAKWITDCVFENGPRPDIQGLRIRLAGFRLVFFKGFTFFRVLITFSGVWLRADSGIPKVVKEPLALSYAEIDPIL